MNMNQKTLHKVLLSAACAAFLSFGALFGYLVAQGNAGTSHGSAVFPDQAGAILAADSRTSPAALANASAMLESLQQSFRIIGESSLPVVVQIEVSKKATQSQPNSPFRFFFGEDPEDQEPRQQGGFGSGIIIDRKSDTIFIMTNNHVVEGADTFTIRTFDRKEYNATLVGADPKRDIAVLKFDSKDTFQIAKLGDSAVVKPGDIVFAVGSPYAIQNTITQGIISAVGRTDTDFRLTGSAGSGFTDYLQTDAAINQGNSGGALINIYGEVIGVNTWIASRTGGNVGLAFSVPINNAKKVAYDLMNKGKVEYGWLGVSGMELNEQDAKVLGLKTGSGAFVGSIFWDSPAFKSGLRPGDLIVKFGDIKLENANDLVRAVSGSEPNKAYAATIIRDGKTMDLKVTLGIRNDDQVTKMSAWPGFAVSSVTSDVQKRVKGTISIDQVMIANVEENSAADDVGLRQLDVIIAVNGQEVKNLKDYYRVLSTAKGKELQLKLINRAGREVSVSYQP